MSDLTTFERVLLIGLILYVVYPNFAKIVAEILLFPIALLCGYLKHIFSWK